MVRADATAAKVHVAMFEKLLTSQLATHKHETGEQIDERLSAIERAQENIDTELNEKIKRFFAKNIGELKAQLGALPRGG